MTTLARVEIIGFFSLPSPSLAEHNPTAYNLAMRSAPTGAGTCSHCGMGIRHHVVIRDEAGRTRFIGTTCAEKVGLDREQVRGRLTDEQRAAWEAKRQQAADDHRRQRMDAEKAEQARLIARREHVGDIVDLLRSAGGEFYASLADQLEQGPLSPKQARYAAKATSDTGRRNKRNADAWDDVQDRCQWEDGA